MMVELFKGRHCARAWLTRVFLFTLVLLFPFLPVHAYDFQGCPGCHQQSLDRDSVRYNLHAPFASYRCADCHAPRTPAPAKLKAHNNGKLPAARDPRQKVKWLGESIMVATDHWFVVPGNKVGDTMIVESQGLDGRFSRHEIAVPALADLSAAADPGQPPLLSKVQVLQVQRGVFLSATIGWQTNSITDASVRYGKIDGQLAQTASPGKRFGRWHEVVLYQLQPDQTYNFQAVSKDLFGRSQSSEILTFSTSHPLDQSLPENASPASEEIGVTSQFYRLGKDYLLDLALAQPAAVSVGWTGEARNRKEVSNPAAPGGAEDAHSGLRDEEFISSAVCKNCHPDQNRATHPVNVYPKPGMTIPPEYPTLPDGRITCNSCHNPHSSDYEYLSRKPGKRELCVGCHTDML